MSEPTSTNAAGLRVRLRRLEIHNYQAIKVAAFDIKPGVNDIAGEPAQGKSTIPQAIRELLTKGGVSSMPLRRGAAEGLIRAELTDGSVLEKKITPKGAQPTRRTDADGKRTGIDSLQGWITEEVFNPLAFAALADSKAGRRTQAEVISEIAGLDTAKLDEQRAAHLAEESAAKKAAEELEAQARGVVVPEEVAVPGEEIDLASFATRKGEIERQRYDQTLQRKAADDAGREAALAADRVAKLDKEIADLETKLADARGRRQRADEEANAKHSHAAELAAQVATLVEPDGSALETEIEQARQHNARVRAAQQANEERGRKLAERAGLEQKAAAKRTVERGAAMKKREADAAKAEAIAAAARRMPVSGLTIEGEGADREVYLNGVPLSQASTMQRMQLGCALALARQPRLGFLWIDYGNELDEKALEWLQGFLEANNADAFVVHVIEAEEVASADGLIVEAGEIKADRRRTRKPRSAAATERAAAAASADATTDDDEPPTL